MYVNKSNLYFTALQLFVMWQSLFIVWVVHYTRGPLLVFPPR